jgi:hypothetical protein
MPRHQLFPALGSWLSGAARSPVVLATGLATVLSMIWVFLPPTGSDLAAQVAHANFFGRDGWLPVDMRWFGGTDVLGYSVISPALMAAVGVSAFGVLTTVAASALLALLLQRSGVPHPRAAALLGVACFVANLMVGRLTFALGLAVGLATLLMLWVPGRVRVPLLALGTLLTWAASPLAALFLAMVGVALVLRRRVAEGVTMAMTGGVVLLLSAAIGQRGVMPMDGWDAVRGVLACALVAFVTRYQVVRIVAALSALSVVAAYFVASPVGFNATRFPAIFAVPVALATSRLPWRRLVPVLVATLLLIPPMSLSDAVVGQPATQRHFFSGLDHALLSRTITGRVEVVPTANRWEAVYVARRIPLARGWMTQVDKADNPLFFDPTLMTAGNYRVWLRQNAVQYVAVSVAPPAAAGASEKSLVESGLPYLTAVWHNAFWTLYAVDHPTTTVQGATLLRQDGGGVTFDALRAGPVHVRVLWSRWLTLDGPQACLREAGRWTQVMVSVPGVYRLSSELIPDGRSVLCADHEESHH